MAGAPKALPLTGFFACALCVCWLRGVLDAVADDTDPGQDRIEPDRRDFTSGTGIVPLGSIQAESGGTWERSDSQRQFTVGEITLRVPVSSAVELHFGLPSYLVRNEGGHQTGLDDASIEARWRFYQGKRLDWALQVMTILPSGSRRVAEHDWQPGAVLAASLKITEAIQLVTSAGGNRVTADGVRFSQAVAASSLRFDIAPRWNVFTEAYVNSREEAGGPARRYADVGLVYFLSPTAAFDARLGKGIRNGRDTNTFASAGFSFRF